MNRIVYNAMLVRITHIDHKKRALNLA